MRLHRKGERSWLVAVSSHKAELASAEQVALWRDQIAAAVAGAGLDIASVWVPPDLDGRI